MSASRVYSFLLLLGSPSMISLSTKGYYIFFLKSNFDVHRFPWFPLGNATEPHSSKVRELPYENFNQIFLLNFIKGCKFPPLISWLLFPFHFPSSASVVSSDPQGRGSIFGCLLKHQSLEEIICLSFQKKGSDSV